MKIFLLCFVGLSAAAAVINKPSLAVSSCRNESCAGDEGWHETKSTWKRPGFVHEDRIAARDVLAKRSIEKRGAAQPVKQAKNPVKPQPLSDASPRANTTPKTPPLDPKSSKKTSTIPRQAVKGDAAFEVVQARGVLSSVKKTGNIKAVDQTQHGSPRGESLQRSYNAQGLSGKAATKGKGQRLCRRGNEIESCESPILAGGSPRSPMSPSAPVTQKMSRVQDVEARKKMETTLATQASLDIRKAKNSKSTNRLTTGILGTSLAGGVTGTSATLPGLCCHGAACGSHLTCAVVATGALGSAGICLACAAAALTGYKAWHDHKNAKEMESKLDRAYGEVQKAKADQASHDRRINEESKGRQALAKEVGHNRKQIERTSETIDQTRAKLDDVDKSVGKHKAKLDDVDKTVSSTVKRVDSVKEGLDNTKKGLDDTKNQVKLAFGRTDSLGRGVADAKNQAMHASNSVEDMKATVQEAKMDASKASSSYGDLKRTNSERWREHGRIIDQMRSAMAKAGIELEMEPLMHNSPHY